jgi:hypothetical protein
MSRAEDICREWPHHWFGFFRGDSQANAKRFPTVPRVSDFIDPQWNYARKLELLRYLRLSLYTAAPILPSHGKCLLCDLMLPVAQHHWDGSWLWFGGLPHYVEAHSVRVPDRMLADMEGHAFEPPSNLPLVPFDKLPWPPLRRRQTPLSWMTSLLRRK